MWLTRQKADIIFLQETYSTKEVEDIWNTQYKGKVFYSHGTNHSCGVMILIKDDVEFEYKSSVLDTNGRYILIDATVQGSDFLLVNIYAPNKVQEQCEFFSGLEIMVEEFNTSAEQKIVVGGDFNVAIDPDLDCSGGNPTKKDSVKHIQDICLNFDLVDIWRVRNPVCKRFSWRQKNPFLQRRLDYWLLSDSYQEEVEGADIIPSLNSDHSAIVLHFKSVEKQKHGPSYWKFNASLLDDSDFCKLIAESVPVWREEFIEVTDKRVLWDLIKYRIRQVTIKYSKAKAKARRQNLKVIEDSLKQCEEDCSVFPSPENMEKMENIRNEYELFYEHLSRGAIVRSRATWFEQGEKSNKYFLNLETYKKSKSCIRKVFTKDGFLSSDPKRIMKEVEVFYSSLYKTDNSKIPNDVSNTFLLSQAIPKLSNEEAMACEGRLTLAECFKSLRSFQSNKSPGNDGLTVEFYNAFWESLGKLLVDSLNCSFDKGELSNSQKQAIITLIEKKDKDKRKISNWRPISLINVDVKIGSKAIALRLQTVLPRIIHHNQHAYVKGRTINDAIRTIDDILVYTERYGINGKMLAIDFQKAFDSVNRNFLFSTLAAFNFGSSFIQWIQTFYQNISSCVLNNGFSTGPFEIQRGVRQGDPLSPYLFIIVLEVLAVSIRKNKDIQGIVVDGIEVKLELFADDLTVFLRNDGSVRHLLALISKFGICSGLVINFDKTEMFILGNSVMAPAQDQSIMNINVKRAVKILGVYFTYDSRLRHKLNFKEIIDAVKTKLQLWKWRNLTIIGRIQIVKTFVIPLIMYRAGSICIDKEVVTEANRIIFDFIWKGKDKVKRASLVGDIKDGGLKAPHLESIIKTHRIMLCQRLADGEPCNWKTILFHYLKQVGGKFILCCNFDIKKLPINLPMYYRECFECFSHCSAATDNNVLELSHEQISNTVLWNNKFICINNKSVFNQSLVSKGIIKVGDLVTEKNQFISQCNQSRVNLSPKDIFDLMSLVDAIPAPWRQSLKINGYLNKSPFVIQDQIQLVLNNQEVSITEATFKKVYRELVSGFVTPPTAHSKFNESFNGVCLDWNEIHSLPFLVALDTKSREFQYKILNRYLVTNTFLKKIGKIDSSLCTFCGMLDESLEHLFVTCHFTTLLWKELIAWCSRRQIKVESLSAANIIFGDWQRKDCFLLLNHIILIAKQYIYYCRSNNLKPLFYVLLQRIKFVYQLESKIAKWNNNWQVHSIKWDKSGFEDVED